MNLTDFKEAEAVMKILDHSDLDVPYCFPAVSMAESVPLYMWDHCQNTSCGSLL